MKYNMRRKIIFLLPGQGTKPAGGFKIVYEYADGLAQWGYAVEVLHIAWKYNTTNIIKGISKYFFFLLTFKPIRWFKFNNLVILRWCLFPKKLVADYIIATSWETAEILKKIVKDGQIPIYFIQGDETKFDEVCRMNWEQRVVSTWKYNWKKIVVAEYLKQTIKKYDNNVIRISNGLDFNHYKIYKSINNRNCWNIAMIAHMFKLKGTEDGVKALEIVHKKYNNLEVTFFSVYPRMDYIPEWINYKFNPTQEEIIEIYNNSSIFISASYTEGFGLPVAEAMACGCCTIITDISSYHDFTLPNKTSLYSPVGNYKIMAKNIITVLEDDPLRQNLAINGLKYVKEKLSLEQSVTKFRSVMGLV
jgi:glycosyltransferase involved in cell wall biosynthesis